MSYNTRRSRGVSGMYASYSTANIGQRRPLPGTLDRLSNNFTSGGQLEVPINPLLQMPGEQQQQPQQHRRQQQQQQQELQTPSVQLLPNLRQAQQFINQQQEQSSPQISSTQQQQQQQQKPVLEQSAIQEQPAVKPESSKGGTSSESINGNNTTEAASEISTEQKAPKKIVWPKKDGKINKKEKLKRRNQRLKKILQPKNALMVLNELVGSTPYNVMDIPNAYDGMMFKCSVLVDGVEHIGYGKSKPAAKTAAAEAALKNMVLSKIKIPPSEETTTTVDSEGDIKMEMESEGTSSGISWSHVACYALHKLLYSWKESASYADKLMFASSPMSGIINSSPGPISNHSKAVDHRPAKKLPVSAPTLNPLMLLNQMFPNAVFEEVGRVGNTPNVQFSIRCTIGDNSFFGTGSTKKAARKICAFGACQKLLQVQYSPQFLENHGVTLTDSGFMYTNLVQ